MCGCHIFIAPDEVIISTFQERDIKQLLLEVKALEQSASSATSGTVDDEDSPKLAALKLQNAKLKYRITHLQKVLITCAVLLMVTLLGHLVVTRAYYAVS